MLPTRSLPIPMDPGSNPVTCNFFCLIIYFLTVGSAVASDTRDSGLNSCHRQLILFNYLLFVEKIKINKKCPGLDHFKTIIMDQKSWQFFEVLFSIRTHFCKNYDTGKIVANGLTLKK